MNFSGGMDCCANCDRFCNCGNLNGFLQNALSAGVVTTACGGNSCDGNPNTCDVWYPSYRPEVISVSYLNGDGTPYGQQVVWPTQCSGPLVHRVSNSGQTVLTAGIDILAPGRLENAFGLGFNNYHSGTIQGCSYASPVAAGLLADLRHAFRALGLIGTAPAHIGRALIANFLVLGDASDGTASGQSVDRVHNMAGFGRIRTRVPSGADLPSPWGWAWSNYVLSTGGEVWIDFGSTGPESSLVTTWKTAVVWFDPNLNATSDVTLEMFDVCPPGGGPPTLVAADTSYNLRKRLRLSQSQIGGRCLQARVRAWNTPSGGTSIYVANYYAGGSTSDH